MNFAYSFIAVYLVLYFIQKHSNDWYEATYKQLREWFFSWRWDEVYDFIEFVAMIDGPVNRCKYWMRWQTKRPRAIKFKVLENGKHILGCIEG